MASSLHSHTLLTQRNLLQKVQVAGEELLPQGVVKMKRHTVLAHLIICLRPAVPEGLMRPAKLHRCGFRHSEASSAMWCEMIANAWLSIKS